MAAIPRAFTQAHLGTSVDAGPGLRRGCRQGHRRGVHHLVGPVQYGAGWVRRRSMPRRKPDRTNSRPRLRQKRSDKRSATWTAARMDCVMVRPSGQLHRAGHSPLGYDGRMGVALIASFAAREVFVGTMATLYAAPEATRALERSSGVWLRRSTRPPAAPYWARPRPCRSLSSTCWPCNASLPLPSSRQELGSWKLAALQALGHDVDGLPGGLGDVLPPQLRASTHIRWACSLAQRHHSAAR